MLTPHLDGGKKRDDGQVRFETRSLAFVWHSYLRQYANKLSSLDLTIQHLILGPILSEHIMTKVEA